MLVFVFIASSCAERAARCMAACHVPYGFVFR